MTEPDALQRLADLRDKRRQAAAAGDVETVIACRAEAGKISDLIRRMRMAQGANDER